MDLSIKDTTYLKNTKCRPLGKSIISYSLISLVKNNEVNVNDVMKWSWQIAEYGYFLNLCHNQCLNEVNVNSIRIDSNNNVLAFTVFNRIKRSYNDSSILRATYILRYAQSIIEYVLMNSNDNENIKKFKLFNILLQHKLANSKINSMDDMVAGAYYTIDMLCDFIDDGIIDDLYNTCL